MKKIVFYGTRGSSTLTSSKYMEFGGATSCILLNLDNKHFMIDAGSGVNNALDDLKEIDELYVFISHSHIDHIDGIATLFSAFENKKLHVYGKTVNGVSIKDSICRLMSESLWPVRVETYKNVDFNEISGDLKIGNVEIKNMDSNHNGGCSLFRFDSQNDSIVSAFDFCHLDGFDKKLVEFAKGAKILIYDGTLSKEEFESKKDWGHSFAEMGGEIGQKIGCETIYITHFGAFDDETLRRKEAELKEKYKNLVFARSGNIKDELSKLVDIGTMLSSEKDTDKLLFKIVEASMEITEADGGTLYLLEGDNLEFKVLINKSKNTKLVRKEAPLSIPSVKIDGKNLCATSAREKKIINVKDCYTEKEYDFSGTISYDKINNYRTKSVLAIPLINEYDDVVGVLQLINAKNENGETVAFRKEDEQVIMAIANQASMAIVNFSYSQKINDLLYGFVKVMSVGIDERTPYNANHTRNMVKFADRFFDYEEKENGKFKVDSKKRREILMSIWLHDIGKILTPIDIMNKDSRLGEGYKEVENRFSRRELLLKLQLANGEISNAEYDELENERKCQFDLVNEINKVGFLNDGLKEELDKLSKKTYVELDKSVLPILTFDELYQLSIVKGTLNKEERNVMESHVSMTQKFLSQLNFPKYYDMIPTYAGNHHEFLNGSGYPNRLKAEELPWPCRLITVLDIYEALTAKDRPYKKPLSVEKSFSILYDIANNGQLDDDVIKEFEISKAYAE